MTTDATYPLAEPARTRRWAIISLYVLGPVIPELLSGATPVLMFVNPVTFVFQTAMYGSGALLIRELVRRRGLGWRSIVLLGAAYGVVEEGLVVTTWFNPYWEQAASLGDYGRWLDLSWLWALQLVGFHAVISIAAPILVAEALFPSVAGQPWLSRRTRRFLVFWFLLSCVVGLGLVGFVLYRDRGYTHPPASYLIAIGCAATLAWWGLRRRGDSVVATATPQVPPARWRLRLFGFSAMVVGFALLWATRSRIPALAAFIALAALFAGCWWLIVRWSRRAGWGEEQRLALATGAVWFLLTFGPLMELAGISASNDPVTGQTLVSLLALVASFWLAWVVRRRTRSDFAHHSGVAHPSGFAHH